MAGEGEATENPISHSVLPRNWICNGVAGSKEYTLSLFSYFATAVVVVVFAFCLSLFYFF